jgi:hypothetical protein
MMNQNDLYVLNFFLTEDEVKSLKEVIVNSDIPFIQKEMYGREIRRSERANLAKNSKDKIAKLAGQIEHFNNDKSIIECLDALDASIQSLRSTIS